MNCAICGAALPGGAMFCGRCGSAVNFAPLTRSQVSDPRPSDTTVIHPVPKAGTTRPPEAAVGDAPPATVSPGAASWPSLQPAGGEAVEPPPPVPYVLSFSTGERVVVVGSGLLGRRPYPQPDERFDQLVSIADDLRSVSKTHLEFGLESGHLWICDRYSANGSVIIPPSGAPRRCDPGRRFRVPRGSRVEIGDRYFDVR